MFSLEHLVNWTRRLVPVILVLRRWRKEDQWFKVILGYIQDLLGYI